MQLGWRGQGGRARPVLSVPVEAQAAQRDLIRHPQAKCAAGAGVRRRGPGSLPPFPSPVSFSQSWAKWPLLNAAPELGGRCWCRHSRQICRVPRESPVCSSCLSVTTPAPRAIETPQEIAQVGRKMCPRPADVASRA